MPAALDIQLTQPPTPAEAAKLHESIDAGFLLPTEWKEREFTLNWSDAAKIDWGTILLFGTGIIFGSLLADTGLAETVRWYVENRPWWEPLRDPARVRAADAPAHVPA